MAAGERRYDLLGELRVTDEGAPVALGGAKPRALLTILLLRRGRVVPTDTIVEELWAGSPPASATATLHTYVAALRKALGAEVIRTVAPGYVLEDLGAGSDVDEFVRGSAEGRELVERGDTPAGAAALRTALDLWRGPALDEVASLPFAQAEAVRLEEERLSVLRDWASAELDAGRPGVVLGDLQAAVDRWPLREDLCARLALALYRCGRQADALRTIADARSALVEELGLDPGAELAALEGSILAQDAALDLVTPRRVPAGRTRPASDAPPPVRLVGRGDELAALLDDLDATVAGAGRIATVGGEPGIGKTRLAIELAGAAADRGVPVVWGRCPDGHGVPAFEPWRHVVGAVASIVDPAADGLPAGFERLGLIAPAEGATTPIDASHPPPDIQAARFEAYGTVQRLLVRATELSALLVVLDDAHWADPASLELLEFLAPQLVGVPVMLVLTYRSTDPAPSSAFTSSLAVLSRAGARRLSLGGLSVDETAELLDANDVAGDRAPSVLAQTNGNPFFIGEVARWWTSAGDDARSGVPDAVGDVIRSRVSRLPAPTSALLRDASVLGVEIDAEHLADVISGGVAGVIDDLGPAIEAGLLAASDRRGQWRFAHGLVAETLAGDVAAGRTMELHQRAAGALAKRYGTASGPHLAAWADHLANAVPVVARRDAIDALRTSAAWAASTYAHEQAIEQLELAAELVGELGGGAEQAAIELLVLDQRARLLLVTSGYASPGLSALCTRMTALCDLLAEGHDLLAPTRWLLCAIHVARAELVAAQVLADQIVAGSRDDEVVRLLGAIAAGTVATHLGAFDTGRRHLDDAVRMSRVADHLQLTELIPETPLVWSLVFSAWNHWAVGRTDVAEAELVEAIAAGAAVGGGSYPETFARWFSTLIPALADEPELVLSRVGPAIEQAVAGGNAMVVPFMMANQGWALGATGDPGSGLPLIRAAEEGLGGAGVRMLSHVFAAFAAGTQLRAGDPAAALADARRGIEALALGERWYEAELHRLEGMALLSLGQADEGRAALARAVDVADRQGAVALGERARESLASLD